MTGLEAAIIAVLTWLNGLLLGYVIWAPETPFKRGFVEGMTLKFLWGKKRGLRK